jgi:hypothetical protein
MSNQRSTGRVVEDPRVANRARRVGRGAAGLKGAWRRRLAISLIGLFLAPPAFAIDGTIALETLIPYAKRDEIPKNIRKECGMGAKLSRHIVYRGQERGFTFNRVGSLKDAKESRILRVRITDALELKGGINPEKTVTIDGVLKENDKAVGTFEATRFAQASFFPLVRSDCKIYSKAVKKLARDIAEWLEKPEMGSRLGDVR